MGEARPGNLVVSGDETDFWVWIDPANRLVRQELTDKGCFVSPGGIYGGDAALPFVPNPNFSGDISPFTIGLTHQYATEYNLEVSRLHFFPRYPSRLNAIFLLQSEADAKAYGQRHQEHVKGRVLKRVRSCDDYTYSAHDSAWVDLLRENLGSNRDDIRRAAQAYWAGKRWSQEPVIMEVLFMGRIEFYDRSL